MESNSSFLMWGERGMIATFFNDLHRLQDTSKFDDFLSLLNFENPSILTEEKPKNIHYIIEPDFANTGFGHPDAIIALEYCEYKTVILVEAKRKAYKKACDKIRGSEGYNSTLNGQLELNYRLSLALSNYKKGDKELIEPKWIPSSPYKEDKSRRLQNKNVLQNVVSKINGFSLDRYYHLIITTDNHNPYDTATSFLPELYKVIMTDGDIDFKNAWEEYRRQFGWINYDSLEDYIKKISRGRLSNIFSVKILFV